MCLVSLHTATTRAAELTEADSRATRIGYKKSGGANACAVCEHFTSGSNGLGTCPFAPGVSVSVTGGCTKHFLKK
jgi:hypothetical protein